MAIRAEGEPASWERTRAFLQQNGVEVYQTSINHSLPSDWLQETTDPKTMVLRKRFGGPDLKVTLQSEGNQQKVSAEVSLQDEVVCTIVPLKRVGLGYASLSIHGVKEESALDNVESVDVNLHTGRVKETRERWISTILP